MVPYSVLPFIKLLIVPLFSLDEAISQRIPGGKVEGLKLRKADCEMGNKIKERKAISRGDEKIDKQQEPDSEGS